MRRLQGLSSNGKLGKIYDYLGMTLDYSNKGKVKIDMRDYLKMLAELDNLTNRWHWLSVTPAADHLFNSNPDATKLNCKDSERFHHIVDQLLFLCKRGQPDVQTGMNFLTT